jgi:hypothetical protein
MTRRRYIQRDGVLIEVPLNYSPEPKNSDAALWNDRAYQDVGDPRFHSRTSHREFMKREGLTTVDDFKGHFASAEQQRAQALQGKDVSRKGDIARALEKHRG